MSEDKRRPWKDKGVSWIYFVDQIKDSDEFIYDEIDGNKFMFDCATGRLSIWSERWNAFADVGISSLLQCENGIKRKKIDEELQGVRIFYKGIELESRCIERNTELLECIDIKGELERSFINISRRGFTPEGERYFEEQLYPGLLEIVKRVLKHLEKQAKHEKDNNIKKKIKKVVEKKCNEIVEKIQKNSEDELKRLERELISLTVSIAVLSYFAVRDEWNILDTISNKVEERKNIWHEIVEEINGVFQRKENTILIKELEEMTTFFNIKVYDEAYQEHIERGEQVNRLNFTQIFLPNNHWAIVQVRKDSSSEWNDYLVRLHSGDKADFNRLLRFPRTQEDEKILEYWGNSLCEATKQFKGARNNEQQFLINWMLKNMVTIAMFSDFTGNVRVNILGNKIFPSIYLNRNYKYLIVDRILQNAHDDEIGRFSTITWQGFENLSCLELPYSIYFVKRGGISKKSFYKIIIPFDGGLLREWKDELIKGIANDFLKKLANLRQKMNIRQYLEEVMHRDIEHEKELKEYLIQGDINSILNIATDMYDVIIAHIKDRGKTELLSFNELIETNLERDVKWYELYRDVAKWGIFVNSPEADEDKGEELLNKILANSELDSLCDAWIHVYKYVVGNGASIHGIENRYKKYIKENPNYLQKEEKMIQYMLGNLRYEISEDNIRESLNLYKQEILNLVIDLENEPVRRFLQESIRRDKYMITRLNTIYTAKRK